MAKKRRRIAYHPACTLFPELPRDELEALAEDIKANGLRDSIVRHKGKILEGRNRFRACHLAGVEPRFTEWDGNGSPVEFVISRNLTRRHLTSSQRAAIAVKLLPLLEKEASERQRAGRTLAKKCAKVGDNGKASEAAARLTRTNSRYVEAVKAIDGQAPELVEKIRDGVVKATETGSLPAHR